MGWKGSLELELQRVDAELEREGQEIENELLEIERRRTAMIEAFNKESSLEALVRWSLPILAVVIMFVVLVGNAESEGGRDGNGLRTMMRLLTVVLLIASILILGLSNKIDSEVLGALIGGISGYVLGRHDDDKTPSNARPHGAEASLPARVEEPDRDRVDGQTGPVSREAPAANPSVRLPVLRRQRIREMKLRSRPASRVVGRATLTPPPGGYAFVGRHQ